MLSYIFPRLIAPSTKSRNRAMAIATTAVLACASSVIGCAGDKGVAPAPRPASSTLGNIQLSAVNVVMAVGDTLTITATGRTLTGTPVTEFDSVRYALQNVTDTLRARLAPTGTVTAIAVSGTGTPVLLNVFAFKGGVVAVDQANLQVTQSRIVGAALSLQPIPPATTTLATGQSKTLVPRIANGSGQQVASPRLRFDYSATDSQKVSCYAPRITETSTYTQGELNLTDCGSKHLSLNQIYALQAGTAWVRASVLVYGTMLRDSVQYTFTNPLTGEIDVGPSNVLSAFVPVRNGVVIVPGGTVTFYNAFDPSFAASLTFTFDNPTAATAADDPSTDGGQSGNVTPLSGYQFTMRKFSTPGVYTWTAVISGSVPPWTGQTTSGTITVQ